MGSSTIMGGCAVVDGIDIFSVIAARRSVQRAEHGDNGGHCQDNRENNSRNRDRHRRTESCCPQKCAFFCIYGAWHIDDERAQEQWGRQEEGLSAGHGDMRYLCCLR